ncbi:uncharacterized protein PF11_0213-like [Colletes gigas]|uniref:uncharacterized protein PF11_0213-like n=1 Tax=Colletes gigas TaxID=935657 RepID=UPI001C9A53B0|nr:uncharacterized protein PF11_0213-like [Colletes gigas]
MCDLIDLNSPVRKGLLSSQLASPLIPVPTDTACNNCNNHINEPNSLVIGKRNSLENNPFDMVLHKTTEYIQKKHDPFEVTLKKALKPKYKKNTPIRNCSFDFKDDYSLKQKRYPQKLKMNRTLDESLINKELTQRNLSTNKRVNESVKFDLNKTNFLRDDLKSDSNNSSFSKNTNNICDIDIQVNDLSILNQSVMNDTLFETDTELNKERMKSISQNETSICIEKDKDNINLIPSSTTFLGIPKFQRSLSETKDELSKKSKNLKELSLVEPLRINSRSRSSVSSLYSLDLLNEGFLSSRSSVFSSLSNVSSIHRINSVSSTSHPSIMLSDGTINRTFLESCSSEKSDLSRLTEQMDFTKETKSVLPTSRHSITSVTNVLNKDQSSISDLTNRFNELKMKTLELSLENSAKEKNKTTSVFSDDINTCVSVTKRSEECHTNDKLIDVDVFTPDMNCSKEYCTTSISDTSSDSVFTEGNTINKSILHEAKVLSKTFKELALKSSLESSIDDLMSNNLSWTSELLPAFDDEVDNLIELPTSPNENNLNSKNKIVTEHIHNDSYANKNEELVINTVKEKIKDLETELIDPISIDKRITTATLLLDLKKLITIENNIEANKLLENLEKVLGINWENNTELLTTYLSPTNNLSKSPQKSNNSLEIKNVTENNMEFSQEDNLTNGLPNDIKGSGICSNMNFNDSNNKYSANNKECLKEINSNGTENIKKETDENDLDIQNTCKKHSSCKTNDNNCLNEKVAIELLTNIGKLLTEQTEEHSTLNLLKNLGKVLNFASNNCNVNENTKSDNNGIEAQQTSKKSKAKFENKTQTSIKTKSVNKLSLSTISTVKTKFKTKVGGDIPHKKGPLKAVLPIGNMQKKDTINKKAIPTTSSVTPPKSHKIISSTPNSTDNIAKNKYTVNKSSQSSKPVASSTPDSLNFKTCKIQSQISNYSRKRNISCDISPVTTRRNVSNSNGVNNSPKRISKLQSPKKTTPKRRSSNSSIPKSQTPPVSKRLNSSLDVNHYERLSELPQQSYKLSNSQKNSPVSLKNTGCNMQQSPLRNSNKIMHKVKPINLISKLRRHSVGTNVMEKENNYINY